MKTKCKDIKNNLINILKNIELKKYTRREINFFKNKTILITGVSGIIGLNLLFFFYKLNVEKKNKIIIEATFNKYLFDFIKTYFKKNKKIKFQKIDLSVNKINKKKKFDLIFHCAGYGQPAKFLREKSATYKLNSKTIMDLTLNLKKEGKLVYMSTTEIYSGNNKICTELSTGKTSTQHPRSTYIESKKFGESFIINCVNKFLIFRVCLAYGPGAKLDDERVINQVILRSIRNENIDVYGGLNQLRSNLYIEDVIGFVIKAIVRSSNEIFNINNHSMTTLGKIFLLLSKIANKKLINHVSKINGSPKIIRISNKKIREITKYKISTNIKQGLLKTINWYSNLLKLNKEI
jgi:nucleoside-diphosphate-sugar epimerase